MRPGEYGGWFNTFPWVFAKKLRILKAECMDALSWWNNQELFAHNSGQTWRIHSRICRRVFKYRSAFIVVFWGQKFRMDQACLIEKCNKHCFHLQLRHPGFLRPRFTLANPLYTLTTSLWVVLEKPRLVAGYHTFENVFWLNCFKPITANINSCFFCSSVRFFGTSLVQSFCRCISSFTIEQTVSQLISDGQMAVYVEQLLHMFDIRGCSSFNVSAMPRIVLHIFSTISKTLNPVINCWFFKWSFEY